jgi:hypothetical protein
MKTKSELKELYRQVRGNPYLIRYLSESDAVQLINLVNEVIDAWMKEVPETFYKTDYYKEHISLMADLKIHIDSLLKPGNQDVEPIPSPIIFAKQIEMDTTLKKCKDELTGIDFSKMDYASLYSIIYDKFTNYFNTDKFIEIQKYFDSYFGTDSGTYKKSGLKDNCAHLKKKYRWIDKLD